jgi:phosphatidylinositol-3,4,5-trisphosphate 3-phosphatase/dual-specificity protein phosphatase PTEN
VAAVHCKAGKGRTGVTISCYLLFIEASTDSYEAIKFFNSKRTTDGKGMGVASQKRYVHYFEKFLKSNF